MPLTKPECLDCSYSLKGTRFGEMCPECGCVERKLLFDGSSRVLSISMMFVGFVLLTSLGVVIASEAHTYLFPQLKTAWVLDTTFKLKRALIPGLITSGSLILIMSYAVWIVSYINHSMNRTRTLQIVGCVLLSAVSLATAILWPN